MPKVVKIYHTKMWQWTRAQILRRDKYKCIRCGSRKGLEVHHIHPLESGGAPFTQANLETLCRDCHLRHHDKTRKPQRPKIIGRDEWKEFTRDRI